MIQASCERSHGADGFTLVEALVSTLLLLVVTGAIFANVNPNLSSSHVEPDAIDVQQRARVAAEALTRDLRMAGAGFDGGALAGPLVRYLPPVVPRRLGLTGADPAATARPDAITLTWIVGAPGQAILAGPALPGPTELVVTGAPPCPFGRPLCGMAVGDDVLMFDALGHFDVFTIGGIAAGVGSLQHHDPGPPHSYPAGTPVGVAVSRTYYLDAAAQQLKMSDGYLTDVPVADYVVGLAIEYFGDPSPPIEPRPPLGSANCLYDAAGTPVAAMAALAPAGGSLAPLPLALFQDGPWCGQGGTLFDADLLRIRRVRISLRVRTARMSPRLRPDFHLRVDVSPRNLHLAK